ncbi:MAG: hypothetical protein IT208_03615 [Chthonomonadales bacterium]|nr:hypothetical protein [Chthonomonadales bacterium]
MNHECWLEMDLYWFQGAPVDQRVTALFDRLEPLWQREPRARKGLSLCVGWLFDAVLCWNGRPNDVIPCCQAPTYEPWTYGRLAGLVAAIRREAERRGIGSFHVALPLIGTATQSYPETACEGWAGRTEEAHERARYDIEGRWFPEHPEVRDPRFDVFYFGAPVRVPPDETICTQALPTLGDYFADKLCDLSRYVGFGALVLRDHIFSPAYVRGHTRGRYMAPESRDAWNDALIAMLARIKRNLPRMVTIGYSSGTSAMEEWRSHGFDLERVAGAGSLDLWITQTWASAWGDYWPAHSMGFTFQLANALVQQAMLARTPCRHLFLIETFDAWEPWDSVHQYPGKVSWEVWAYSHAAVLGPDAAVARSAGFYMSWMNRRDELLPADTVAFLRGTLDACAEDLRREPTPGGPCLVYHREGLEASLGAPAEWSCGEEMDDWAAMLLKYGVPVLSITRGEWLPGVRADGYLFALASTLPTGASERLLGELEAGRPVLLMGQASAVDPALRERLGLRALHEPRTAAFPSPATLAPDLARAAGTTGVVLNQRARSLAPGGAFEPLIDCLGGPVLARHAALPCWMWETPEWGTPGELHLTCQSIQSPQTYHALAMALGAGGWGPERLTWRNRDWQKPVCFLFWRYPSGELGVLLANLETGVTGNSQFRVHGELGGARDIACLQPTAIGAPSLLSLQGGRAAVGLGAHRACVLSVAIGPADRGV